MDCATDFAIYQVNEQGYADVPFEGELQDEFLNFDGVWVRAFLEENNLEVVRWVRAKVEGRQYRATLRLPAGGLYRLEANAGSEKDYNTCAKIKIVRHVGVGMLYLVAGQSNMAGYGRDMAYDPPELGVHSFGNNGKWHIASHPLNSFIDTIYPENYEWGNATSPALAFARTMKRGLGLPIGLVQASLGGSPLRDWSPDEGGHLYRAMLRRIPKVGPVGGIVWHQGCSDANSKDGPTYLARFKAAVEGWRRELGDIPVITAQINRWIGAPLDGDFDIYAAHVREAQRQAAREIPKVSVASTLDMPLSDEIHNSSGANVIIGERMALAALKSIYSKPGIAFPDVSRAVLTEKNKIELYTHDADDMPFNNAGALVREVVAQDGQGYIKCTSCELSNTHILLEFEREISLPAKLHYALHNQVDCHPARNRQNLPLLGFYGVEIE